MTSSSSTSKTHSSSHDTNTVFKPTKLCDLEAPKISCGEFLLQNIRKGAADGKTALIWADKGTQISYGDLLRDAVQVATGLQKMGAKSGDTMGVVTRNTPELFSFIIGCLFAGLKIAPSIAELSPGELKSNFETTKPRYILTRPEKAADVEEAMSGIHPRPEIILLEEKSFKEILAKGSHGNPNTFQVAKVEDPTQHDYAYMFSSGTTGKQKAIFKKDFYMLDSTYAVVGGMLKHTGPVLCASQINWGSWFYMLFRSVITGRPWVFATEGSLDSILQYIHKYKPTLYICPPSIIYAIANALEQHPGRWDLSSLKAILTGGDRLGADKQRELSEKLKVPIYQEYGSSEIGFVSTADLGNDPVYGSAGKLVRELKLVDPDTREEISERNKPGEICVQTQNGYLGNPKSTAEAFDAQGWFHSGDLGYLTENNDLFIVDRIKEMLKYKGYQVTPTELEDIIREIPEVADVAVGGKNDDIAGSLITAVVVRKPGSDLSEDDIHKFMATKNLHDSKRLRGGVIFVEELPKNANGKLARRSLAKMLNPTNE